MPTQEDRVFDLMDMTPCAHGNVEVYSFGMCMSDSGAVGKMEYVNALKSTSTFVDVVFITELSTCIW